MNFLRHRENHYRVPARENGTRIRHYPSSSDFVCTVSVAHNTVQRLSFSKYSAHHSGSLTVLQCNKHSHLHFTFNLKNSWCEINVGSPSTFTEKHWYFLCKGNGARNVQNVVTHSDGRDRKRCPDEMVLEDI